MKWIAVSGSWRAPEQVFGKQVRETVRAIMTRGDGVLLGGGVGVDWVALSEALKHDPDAERTRVYLACPFLTFADHYRKRAHQGLVTHDHAETLIAQIDRLRKRRPDALIEGHGSLVDKHAYYTRNTHLINAADELIAFRAFTDASVAAGTTDAIKKAESKGIPVQIFEKDLRSKGFNR
jgi:hypothetical protein